MYVCGMVAGAGQEGKTTGEEERTKKGRWHENIFRLMIKSNMQRGPHQTHVKHTEGSAESNVASTHQPLPTPSDRQSSDPGEKKHSLRQGTKGHTHMYMYT